MKVLINGKEDSFTHVHTSGNGDRQYNTSGNKSAFTFPAHNCPEMWPKDKPVKTSGVTIIIPSKQ